MEWIFVPADDFEEFCRSGAVLRAWQSEACDADVGSSFDAHRVASRLGHPKRVLKVYVWDRELVDWGRSTAGEALGQVTGPVTRPRATFVCVFVAP